MFLSAPLSLTISPPLNQATVPLAILHRPCVHPRVGHEHQSTHLSVAGASPQEDHRGLGKKTERLSPPPPPTPPAPPSLVTM